MKGYSETQYSELWDDMGRLKRMDVTNVQGEELNKPVREEKHRGCPYWGVIGHWRIYKSGKKTWVKPHKRGAMRNNPEAYKAKDYRLEG